MIKCPSCNADNLLGAIFCRTCGKKLDIENLRPEQMDNKPKKAAKKAGTIVRNIVVLLLIVIVIGVVALLFWPPAGLFTVGEEEGVEKAKEAGKELLAANHPEVTLDQETVTAFARHIFYLTAERSAERTEKDMYKGTFVPEQIWIRLSGEVTMRIVMKGKLFGTVPLYLTLVVSPARDLENGGYRLRVMFTKVGRLPMLAKFLDDKVAASFTKLLEADNEFEKFNDGLFGKLTMLNLATGEIKLQADTTLTK